LGGNSKARGRLSERSLCSVNLPIELSDHGRRAALRYALLSSQPFAKLASPDDWAQIGGHANPHSKSTIDFAKVFHRLSPSLLSPVLSLVL
jgi:hypothetical protein